MSFIEAGLNRIALVIKSGYTQLELSSKNSFFHRIDPRIKIIFLLMFVVIVSLKKAIMPLIVIAIFILILTIFSRLNICSFYKKVFFLSFFFGFLIALPSAFNVIINGEMILPLIRLPHSYSIWIYNIPEVIGITKEGVSVVSMLTLRVFNSVSISLLVLYTTSFADIIKALKVFRVPDPVLMIITLTYKYIFIFAKTVEDMHLAKKSRLLRKSNNKDARQWASGRIALIFRKSRHCSDEIFKAMLSRGFYGDTRLTGFKKLTQTDWLAGISLLFIGVLFLWL